LAGLYFYFSPPLRQNAGWVGAVAQHYADPRPGHTKEGS
jgi:hypothetical protein